MPRFGWNPTHGVVGQLGRDMGDAHRRAGVTTAGSSAHFNGIAAKLNGFVVNRGFEGHEELRGWGE